jgi:4'-phosphopantetheinyl transferase
VNAGTAAAVALTAWDDVALWLCPLHEWPSPSRQAFLGDSERTRASRLRFEAHRRRYVAAQIWLREQLAAWLDVSPAGLEFRAGADGKPRLQGTAAVTFNLSHSGDWALVGASRGTEIGVDIEILRRVEDAHALAQRHYTDAELAMCRSHGNPDYAFLQVWTRKEACLKAVGVGLRVAPSSFDTGAASQAVSSCVATPQGVRAVEVVSIDTGIDAVAAVARVKN